jgi:hypothetical protein
LKTIGLPSKNYEQSQILSMFHSPADLSKRKITFKPNFAGRRLGTLRLRRENPKMKIAIAQPLKMTGKDACPTGAKRGVSNRE